MGTGKTSVGKVLSKKLGRPLVDIDQHIEQSHKRKIADIFEKEGELYFRSLEKDAIRWAAQQEGLVITTGGGAVLDAENRENLKRDSHVVALLAKPETVFKRVKNSRKRPLLNKPDMLAEIKKLMIARQPYYQEAHFCFESDGKTSTQLGMKF